MEIPKYVLKKSPINGLGFYHFLHIRGGVGSNGKSEKFRYGGEYDYIVYYASPEEMKGHIGCDRSWCIKTGIIYGEGRTIEEAYNDYLSKHPF